MKPIVPIAVGLVSAAVGAAGGYFVARHQLEGKLESRVEEEVAKEKAFLEFTLSKNKDSDNSQEKITREEDSSEPSEDEEEFDETASGLPKPPEGWQTTEKVSYNKILTGEGYTPVSEIPEGSDYIERSELVSEDDFNENVDEYCQEWITYYADGLFTDHEGQVIPDMETRIGTLHPVFGEMSYTTDLAHYANHDREVLYEIERQNAAYSDVADVSD